VSPWHSLNVFVKLKRHDVEVNKDLLFSRARNEVFMSASLSSRLLKLLEIELPIIQAPMAGSDSPELATAVSEAGGLGSLGCALLSSEKVEDAVRTLRKRTSQPFNLNFFCHEPPSLNKAQESAWLQHLTKFYLELGLDPGVALPTPTRMPFDEGFCSLLESLKPKVVSFHFGLPAPELVTRIKKAGIVVLSTATSVKEALWLEARGCDAVIAQGFEAGGHRGMFLETNTATQTGTMALVPQIADAIHVPVIAAGGIADARGVTAALALGASAVQIGTAYLFCPEARVSNLYRQALHRAKENQTVLTNIFSGRPARGIMNRFIQEVGPMSGLAPQFPLAGAAVAPLRTKSEADGSVDFMQLWSGQAASLCQEMSAGELTKKLATKS
jgi:nitronate monooxygenase